MSRTARIIIVDLLRQYRDELTPAAPAQPRVVRYLEQCIEPEFPPSRAKTLLPLVQATLKELVEGYKPRTSQVGWRDCGQRLAEAEIQHAEGYGYCTREQAEKLRREMQTLFSPLKLLTLTAQVWAAADKQSRHTQQAA